MSITEGQNQSLTSKSQIYPESLSSKFLSRQNDYVPSNFSRNFLYACEICDGPLAPIALCLVCKRASNRKCLHCQREIITGTHFSCNNLIFFAKEVIRHHKSNKNV